MGSTGAVVVMRPEISGAVAMDTAETPIPGLSGREVFGGLSRSKSASKTKSSLVGPSSMPTSPWIRPMGERTWGGELLVVGGSATRLGGSFDRSGGVCWRVSWGGKSTDGGWGSMTMGW